MKSLSENFSGNQVLKEILFFFFGLNIFSQNFSNCLDLVDHPD